MFPSSTHPSIYFHSLFAYVSHFLFLSQISFCFMVSIFSSLNILNSEMHSINKLSSSSSFWFLFTEILYQELEIFICSFRSRSSTSKRVTLRINSINFQYSYFINIILLLLFVFFFLCQLIIWMGFCSHGRMRRKGDSLYVCVSVCVFVCVCSGRGTSSSSHPLNSFK